ncbi:glycosyltransferase family 4 protein [Oceanihabitans sediminis]|uniref:Glycosyltransferase n=1 Tax=Oceanihabitans sediminis TaxID=1812012 RepID=A0A368P6V4_9FLAO|nr:glycosyltransferase family 4 protein [Oceanihabitans sediminis]MDX1279169.1 glycosyltransferase family 4 protein [Oceanihabitans sediminis]MDX1774541.1 glycosyltransferase family 4 protein [Oceanihabitans sediminis]RBP29062.1 glycosyltransferase involved in cell wall biosynthesis [Oceanihabitans sediminis]RCU57011.1 glycosyltransferase [Oceanihabitans sediminis]
MNKKLLIIGYVWPEPKSSAAGSRMMQLISVFKNQNYEITFASPSATSEKAFDLNSIGVEQVSIELNNASFDAFIQALQPDVVLFDRFMMEEQFGWRVAEVCPNALRILDTEDLHFLRKGRHQAFKDNKPFTDAYLFNEVAKREIASIYRCDLTLIISEAEMQILQNRFKVDASLLCYVPFMLDAVSTEAIQSLPKFEERNHFITIGNFLHAPNYNSVLYLKETIWPLIKKQLPKAEIHIYGAYASQKVTQLHNKKEGFIVKGFAEDANLVMQQSKVCLAAIQFGAGLKGKLVEAMQNGTPCVSTTVGAEGMYGELAVNGFVADDPQEFADHTVSLYQDAILWNEKQENGFQILNKRFNKTEIQKEFITTVAALMDDLTFHRQNNFMGQMLQHHTLQSTKFMSKWIEEKNK